MTKIPAQLDGKNVAVDSFCDLFFDFSDYTQQGNRILGFVENKPVCMRFRPDSNYVYIESFAPCEDMSFIAKRLNEPDDELIVQTDLFPGLIIASFWFPES